jgi:hypothetical protein
MLKVCRQKFTKRSQTLAIHFANAGFSDSMMVVNCLCLLRLPSLVYLV